jgi:uncharacterized Zn-finger protein
MEHQTMALDGIPHFHNEAGARAIAIGAAEFMCIGAKPPLDHPHVFLDMGGEKEIVCPYCSTLYRFNPDLVGQTSDPPGCTWTPDPEDAMA